MSTAEQVRAFLSTRAYRYKRAFLNPNGHRVLTDLARFCRAEKSTFHVDPYMAARLDGRREVWLRIKDHLQLTDDQLIKIYGGYDG